MPEDFVIARNPEPDSTLPYLLRLPLPDGAVVLKAKDTWPRTSKIYCHRAEAWPEDPEVVERVATRACTRRGAAIDLVLERGRENRSQFVMAWAKGRQMIFWQSRKTAKQARPDVRVPQARAAGLADLEIVVDHRERYAYSFSDRQVRVTREPLPTGDYGVRHQGALVAAVERKTLTDLVTSLTTGTLKYQLADLATLPHAGLVVEERWSAVFKLDHVRPAVVADGLAECQVDWPSVPIVFCETRKLAQEWTYRFLAAAVAAAQREEAAAPVVGGLAAAPALAPAEPTAAQVRAWAVDRGLRVSNRGRVPAALREAYDAAHRQEADRAPSPFPAGLSR